MAASNDNTEETVERGAFALSDLVLGMMFAALVIGSAVALAYDFRTLSAEAARFAPGEPGTPGRLAPSAPPMPGRDEQLRRYDPASAPTRRAGQTITLPGFDGNPDEALAAPMVFAVGTDGAATAVGRITLTTYDDFEVFLAANPLVQTLTFHSPGGSVRDAMGMALLIREQGIDTALAEHGYCASSCPLAFSGGIDRSLPDSATFGVHQVFTTEGAIGTVQDGMQGAQFVSSQAQQLLDDMGVDARAWIHAMATPPQQLYVFTPDEFSDYAWSTEDGASEG
ncbi:MAG: hypothetical protein KI785_10600 [Devosiaceae bacterium]|nr:hypothetical protein [Devosiaceae bacterium MH13]